MKPKLAIIITYTLIEERNISLNGQSDNKRKLEHDEAYQ